MAGKIKGAAKAAARGRKKLDVEGAGASLEAVEGQSEAAENAKRQDAPPLILPQFDFPALPKIPANPKKFAWAGGLQATIDDAPEGALIEVPTGSYDESAKVLKALHLVAIGEVTIRSDTSTATVTAGGKLVIFEGFRFTQDESQAFGTLATNSGTVVFKKCHFRANHWDAMNIQNDARVFLVDCDVRSEDCRAVKGTNNSLLVAENTAFTSGKRESVQLRKEMVARFTGCKGQCDNAKTASFTFADNVTYLFENAEISHKILIKSCGNKPLTSDVPITLFRNCDVRGENLVVSEGAVCSIHDCRFQGVGLEVRDKAGVRVKGTRFSDNDTPGLFVWGQDATTEVNNTTFIKSSAPAAAVVCKGANLRLYDSQFIDLVGTGIFALHDKVELFVEGCGFGNIAGTALIAQAQGPGAGPNVTITKSLFKQIGGVGLLLLKAAKSEVTASKFENCQLSGIEVNEVSEAKIAQCIFEGNTQCGIVAISSQKLEVTSCDFLRNGMTGLDLRGSTVEVKDSLAVNNVAGGFAFRKASRGTIESSQAGGSQQYGIGVLEGSLVEGKELTLKNCDGLAGLAAGAGTLTLANTTVSGVQNIALLGEGDRSRIVLKGCSIEDNGVGVQVAEKATLTAEGCVFHLNGIHLDALRGAVVSATGSAEQPMKFSETRDGLGIHIHDASTGSFTECEFSGETKAALATDSNVTITKSSITGCMVCGLYWYNGEVSAGSGEINGCTIQNNGACGVQVMGGQVTLTGNTIDSHSIFGVHVHPGAQIVDSENNVLSGNTKKDINIE